MAAFHPSHGKEIDEGSPHAVSNIIFRLSKFPRVMENRDLDDSISLHLDQGRKKPMHPIKSWNIFDALLFKGPKSASAIFNIFIA
jgi:hypothetical protein